MLDKLPDGTTKMDVARKVVTDFIRRIRNGRNLTFIVYGLNPRCKCEDVDVLLPLTEVTDQVKEKLAADIANIVPLGHTPLAKSMEMAGDELAKGKGLCMLVVVTDGMESCKGNPGAVAMRVDKRLNMGGVDLIGLGVEPEETAVLKKLANNSLRYYDLNKGADLDSKLKDLEKKAEARARQDQMLLAKKIEETVREKGGRTGHLEISLAWFNKNDLDLHVIPPAGAKEKIFYKHKTSRDGGQLDVDMNNDYATAIMNPVEHVVWENKAPIGRYKVIVEHYANHGKKDCKDPTHFIVQVKYKGELYETFTGEVSNPSNHTMLVTEFYIHKNGELDHTPPPKKK